MKANLLSFIRGLKNGTPPRFQSYLKSLALVLVLVMSVNVWGGTWTLSYSDFTTGGYAANDGDHTKDKITYYSSNVCQQSSKIQFSSSSGYIYNKTAMPGDITKITLSTTTNFTIKVGTSSNPSSGTTVSSGSTISGSYRYFYIKAGSNTPTTATITITYVDPKPVNTLYLWEAGTQSSNLKGSYKVGDKYTLPSSTKVSCGDKVLVGWSEVEIEETDIKPTSKFYEPGEEVSLAENNTFYAVFANKGESIQKTFTLTINNTNFNKYEDNETEFSVNAIASDKSTFEVKMKRKKVMNQSNKIQFEKNSNSYFYNTTNLNSISSVTINSGSNVSKYLGNSEHPTSGNSTGVPYFTIKGSSSATATASSVTVSFSVSIQSYSNYTTTCETQYNITYSQSTGGEISGPAKSAADKTITLSYEVTPGYQFDGWYGFDEDLNEIDFDGNTFTMPASNVEIEGEFSCATPTFKTNLTEETIERVQNVNAPTLSVEKNESWATYQWQSSANNTVWTDIVGATNASYSPSIATIGTTYYRCLLKNGVSPCETSAPSNVVTLVVSAPSKCETPIFSVATGTYTGAKSVELSCITESAKIYYTTDGTEPSTSSTEYTGAINVFKSMTIRAIAAKDGIESSEEASETYTIQYTVTFAMQSHGQQVPDQKVGYDGYVSEPSTTSITGWTFGGWFKEGACNNQWNFATDKVTGHTILYAKWTMTMYDVKFFNNGNLVQTYNIQEGQTIGTLPTLTSSDAKDARSKTFVGWTEEEVTTWQDQAPAPITSTKVVEKELTLNAVWAKGDGKYQQITSESELIAGNKYVIQNDSKVIAHNSTPTLIQNEVALTEVDGKLTPEDRHLWTLEGSATDGWSFVIDNTHKLSTQGSGTDLTLTGNNTLWTIWNIGETQSSSYTPEYNTDDYFWIFQSDNSKDYYIEYSNSKWITYGISNTSWPSTGQNGYIKIKLYGGTSLTDYITHSSSSPLASIELNTTKVKANYFVGETFTSVGLSATATLGDGITFPIEFNDLVISTPDLTSAGAKTVTVEYTFNGATKSNTYTVNAYSVTVNSVYTDRVNDESVDGNTYTWTPTTGALKFSTQAHYQFNGISEVVGVTSSGSNLSYTLSNPTANVTLTATWQRLFTLQYNSKGGAAVSSVVDVAKNTPVETSPSPKLTGYNLVGWYNNEGYTGDAVTFPYAITKDETLFAKWEVKTTTITLSQAEATTKGTEQVTATWNQPMPEATMPQREHYQFAGYKLNSTLYYNADGTSAKNWDKEDAEATLTAQWTINKHNIILPAVLAGGTLGVSTGTSNVSYDATVTITPNPNAHYTLTALTYQVGENTPVSIKDNLSFKMPDADVTIAATFTEDPKRTISWSVGGSVLSTTSDVYDGTAFSALNPPTIGDNAAGDCADKFMGWAIAPINAQGGIDKDAVQWADGATTSETQNTFYAVFASKVGEEPTSVEFTPTSLGVSGTSAVQKTQQLDDITFTFSAVSLYSQKARMAKSSTISQDKEFGGDIISISFESFAYSAATKGSLTIKGCATANGSYTTIATQGADYNGASVEFTSGYKCFKVEVGSERTADFSKMIVNYKTTSYGNYITQCCQAPKNPLEITNTNLTVKTNGTLELNTTDGNGATKVWASKNGAVAIVDQTGKVTPVSTGKAFISVSQVAKDGYCEQYAEVEIEVIAANEFGISFAAAEGGSTVAKVNDTPTNKATTGTSVTITATPTDDYNFTGWTVNAGGVTLADASAPTTTFTMGEADVEITPSFALKQFTITLNAGTGDVETTSYTEDVHTVVDLPDAAHCQPDVWVFQGWSETNVAEVSSTCPTLVNANYEITKDVTLYAIYKKADGGEKTIGYRIYSNFGGSTKYYVSGVPNQQKMPSTTNVANASIFTIDKVDGTATNIVFQSGTKYLYIDGSGNLTTATNQPTSGNVKKWSVTSSGISSAPGETKSRSLSGRYNSNPVTYEFKDCSVDAIGTTNGNYTNYAVAIEPVIEGAASYHTSPECVSLTWVNEMSDADPVVTYPSAEGKIVLPTETPTSCAPGLYSFVGWTKTEIPTYKTSQQEIVTAEMAAPEHATTYYAEFVNTAGNRYRTSCPETMYAITYKANGGEGEDYIQYSENKTNVTSYDGAAFSKTACSLYQWNTAADGTGKAYKPNANISSLVDIVGDGTTGTLYAQWTGDLSVTGNVNLTSGKGIAVYTTAAAGNLITISCPAIDMVHHIRYKFLDSENNQVSTLKLCNNGTENFNQLTNIATDGVVGAYEQTFSICYTPTEYNQKATYTLLLEGVNQGGTTVFNSCTLSVTVRSLPEQFVIAVKKDKQWYAVPNVLATTASAAPDALTIEVDDANNPTYAILSDNTTNALYKSAGRYESGQHRGAIRFQSVENDKYITASYTKDATSFYMPTGNSDAQQFYLNSTDCNIYKVTLDPAEFIDEDFESRWICMNGTKIGWYKNDNETKNVYFLPVKAITEEIEVTDGQVVNLSDYEVNETTTIIVHAGGILNADKQATVGTLQIEKANGKSGQIIETETLTANNAYFDYTINAQGMKWYDIAVPFEVDRLNGLSFPNGGNFPLNDVLVYNGATRAANGTNGSAWEYQDDGDLVPGVGYDIMFASNVTTVRFTKKADAQLNNEEELEVSTFVSSNQFDANWNYIANNALHYANLGFDDEVNKDVVAQTYVPSSDSYIGYAQDEATYLVGTPFFVQIAKEDFVVWDTETTHEILRAPAMTTNKVERFTLEMSANGEMTDRLFVSADENARDEYQIGKDVAKMGVSSTIAQMWINNYNSKLCANEAVLSNGQATYQLGVFVPKDGEYTIAITSAPENATLYLTIDGQVVWNLSESAYVSTFTKGTHSEFGLLLIANEKVTPTNINGLKGNNKAQKIFKDYNIYILRDAQMYNTQGVKVQ